MPENWEKATTRRIGRQVQKSRKERKMTAQDLADRTAELGHPIGRATITDIDLGRRQSVTVAELLILAAALEISPVALLYEDQFADGAVEVLPGTTTTAAQAALWAAGEIPLGYSQAAHELAVLSHSLVPADQPKNALDLVRERHDYDVAAPLLHTEARLSKVPFEQWMAQLRLLREQRRKIIDGMRELGLIVNDDDSEEDAQ